MNRWVSLAGYALLVFCSQILWVTFAPITTSAAKILHASVGNIGTLTALFPIVYIIVALPAGKWLDAHFRSAIVFGGLCTGIGAAGRLIIPDSYTWQFLMQVILAIGQPFVINAVASYAGRFFPKRERPIAISISSVAMFIGVIFAMIFSPLLYSQGGLTTVLIVFAVPSVLSMVWILIAALTTKMESQTEPATASGTGFLGLLRDKFIWLLAALLSIGLGVFDCLNTWIEPIFNQYGIPGTVSGPLLALMLVAGIFGSVFLPAMVAKRDGRRTFMIFTLTLTAFTFLAIMIWQWVPWVGLWLAFDGFFLLAGFPIIMDWTEKHVKKDQQGIAVGFIMLTSHIGGIILIYIVQLLLKPAYMALGIFVVVNLIGIFLTLKLPKKEKSTPEMKAAK